MNNKIIKNITITAMLAAVSMVLVFIGFSIFPQVEFLKYDPADVPIMILSFMLGPVYGIACSSIVAIFQAIFWSTDGIVGCIMNILSTCSFIIPATLIYRKNKTKKRAVSGLVVGSIIMTVIMLMFNYFITPVYRGIPQQAIVPLLPWIGSFNLIKATINSILTFLLYKHIGKIIRRFN